MEGDTSNKIGPQINNQACEHHPKHALAPDCRRIGLNKLFAKLWRPAHAPTREPEGFFLVQTALPEFGDGIAQMCFQFAPVIGREVRLCGQFVPPVFDGGVQIETGLIFHNLLKVL